MIHYMISIIYLRSPHLRDRIFASIQKKQNGKCRHCKNNITLEDIVVSNRNGRGYYHKYCAEKLHIV